MVERQQIRDEDAQLYIDHKGILAFVTEMRR